MYVVAQIAVFPSFPNTIFAVFFDVLSLNAMSGDSANYAYWVPLDNRNTQPEFEWILHRKYTQSCQYSLSFSSTCTLLSFSRQSSHSWKLFLHRLLSTLIGPSYHSSHCCRYICYRHIVRTYAHHSTIPWKCRNMPRKKAEWSKLIK